MQPRVPLTSSMISRLAIIRTWRDFGSACLRKHVTFHCTKKHDPENSSCREGGRNLAKEGGSVRGLPRRQYGRRSIRQHNVARSSALLHSTVIYAHSCSLKSEQQLPTRGWRLESMSRHIFRLLNTSICHMTRLARGVSCSRNNPLSILITRARLGLSTSVSYSHYYA